MFDFVKGTESAHEDSLRKIAMLEEKYSINFPDILKEYYSKFDGEKIELVTFFIDGFECEVAKIVPIISEKMNFESVTDNDKADGFMPADYYPIARDRGGDYYYWDSQTGKVYLVFVDDYENPFEVAGSVKEFFSKLDLGIAAGSKI